MKLLSYCIPYTNLSLRSPLSPGEIAALFGGRIKEWQWMRFTGGGHHFQGSLTADKFTMSRIIGYRNSFLPVIAGKIVPADRGTFIHLVMRLHVTTAIFLAVWFGFVLLGSMSVAAGLISGKLPFHPALLIPFGMLGFGMALVSWGFWFEALKQKPMLLELFQATEVANDGRRASLWISDSTLIP